MHLCNLKGCLRLARTLQSLKIEGCRRAPLQSCRVAGVHPCNHGMHPCNPEEWLASPLHSQRAPQFLRVWRAPLQSLSLLQGCWHTPLQSLRVAGAPLQTPAIMAALLQSLRVAGVHLCTLKACAPAILKGCWRAPARLEGCWRAPSILKGFWRAPLHYLRVAGVHLQSLSVHRAILKVAGAPAILKGLLAYFCNPQALLACTPAILKGCWHAPFYPCPLRAPLQSLRVLTCAGVTRAILKAWAGVRQELLSNPSCNLRIAGVHPCNYAQCLKVAGVHPAILKFWRAPLRFLRVAGVHPCNP